MVAILATPQPHHTFAFSVDFYSVGIPLLLLIVPWFLVTKVFTTPVSREFRLRDGLGYAAIAAAGWFCAIQLPNIPLTTETESTTMHLMGGLVIAPALALYCVQAYRIERFDKPWMRFLALFGFVAVFGVCNEVFEFAATRFGPMHIELSDASWDIVANSVGALLAFAILEAIRYRFTPWHTPRIQRT